LDSQLLTPPPPLTHTFPDNALPAIKYEPPLKRIMFKKTKSMAKDKKPDLVWSPACLSGKDGWEFTFAQCREIVSNYTDGYARVV
jgi:hypothetical protein